PSSWRPRCCSAPWIRWRRRGCWENVDTGWGPPRRPWPRFSCRAWPRRRPRRPSRADETMTVNREGSFAGITRNRPPAHAISEGRITELNAALSELEPDEAVRCLIITGAGDRIFCAGADLGSAFAGPDVASFLRFGNSVLRRIERFPKPVIAAINGHPCGWGCAISL